MLNNEIIKQAAIELEATEATRVVKVASVLSRLKAWYNSLFDPEYREKVSKLKSDSAQFKSDMAELSKYINEVDESIQTGDIDRYNVALESLKRATQSLSQGLAILGQDAQQATAPPQAQGLDQSKPKVVFRSETLNHPKLKALFIKLFRDAGVEDDMIEKIMQDQQFLRDVENAIENGTMVGSGVVPKGGKNDRRTGEIRITYDTQPFNLTNFPIALQIRAIVTDMSNRENNPKMQMSVMRFEDVKIKKLTTSNFITFMQKTADIDPRFKEYEGTKWEWAFDIDKSRAVAKRYNWGNYVEPVKTKISKEDFASSVRKVWPKIFPNKAITESGIGVLWAQSSLETGNFDSMWNYNLGNVKATEKWTQNNKWTYKPCNETVNGKSIRFDFFDYHPMCYWRAHDTLDEGMTYYLKTIGSSYGEALDSAMAGNTKDFVYKLKEKGYFTADPKTYADAVARKYKSYTGKTGDTTQEDSEADIPENAPAEIKQQTGELLEYFKRITASPLTDIVVQSMANDLLPRSEFTIRINASDEDYAASVEYANVFSNALNSAIDANTDIHSDGNSIEIACSVAGDIKFTTKAASAIGEIVSKAFAKKYKKFVYGSIKPSICKTAMLSEFDIERQRRKFYLKLKVQNV